MLIFNMAVLIASFNWNTLHHTTLFTATGTTWQQFWNCVASQPLTLRSSSKVGDCLYCFIGYLLCAPLSVGRLNYFHNVVKLWFQYNNLITYKGSLYSSFNNIYGSKVYHNKWKTRLVVRLHCKWFVCNISNEQSLLESVIIIYY